MVAAVVTAVFVVLPAGGVIGRNSFVGVRTRATMHDAAAWRRGHQAAVLLSGGGSWSVAAAQRAVRKAPDAS
ncbi:SdpI family protein [Curtobacterium sp. CFBP9011]|uniref:SdpI family protein n=1 Tax=Curtobacterium sp. CFBP9011 TaxID=3096530 RepID=UPI0039C865CD